MVMAAASPLAEAEMEELLDSNGLPDWDYMSGGDSRDPFESKASDWGRLNDGRLVALDYSTPAHLTKEEYDELVRAATWP
jgi:hypothetical protein